jgi:hypothetical protein
MPKRGRNPKGEGKGGKNPEGCRFIFQGKICPHGAACWSVWSHPALTAEPTVDIQACVKASSASSASGASSGGDSSFIDPGRGIKPAIA